MGGILLKCCCLEWRSDTSIRTRQNGYIPISLEDDTTPKPPLTQVPSYEKVLEYIAQYHNQQAQSIPISTEKEEQAMECCICLEEFTQDNPEIRTLCDCGISKNPYHLSCLLEWTERSPCCPVCKKELFYEES